MKTILTLLKFTLLLSGCAAPLFQFQPNIPNGGRAVAIGAHPGNNNVFLVASESGGLFRSTDGGINFAQVSGSTTFWFSDVKFYPENPNIAIATARQDTRTVSGGGIWRSADGGTNWAKPVITPPIVGCRDDFAAYSVTFQAGSTRIWVSTGCGLAYSDDAGVTWSYLPTSTNYSHDKVYAVLAPAANVLKILTDAGVKVSADGGATWSISTTGLPPGIIKGVHNQIAVSPFSHRHLFWAFNYWEWKTQNGKWVAIPHDALYLSTNDGSSWTTVFDNGCDTCINRPPFVKAVGTLSGAANSYDLYYGDGGCTLKRTTVTHGSTPSIPASWNNLAMDHCDPADLAFRNDGRTPSLLAGDGGLYRTIDNGATWTFTGAGDKGYHALQITEVTGQLHNSDSRSDLYFATQDNDIWASGNNGVTWTGKRCCEGFYLNITRKYSADTRLTGVSCAGCGNFIAGALLSSQAGFPNPPNDAGNPRLLKPGQYIQNTSIAGIAGSIFALTTNNGASWISRYGFPEEVRALSQIAGSDTNNPVIFTAVRNPGITSDGHEIIGIRRIANVLGTGTPIVSEVSGFGSLGIFATMFAWYKPYGVNPRDPNHLIVPDIVDNAVKVTRDGGASWQVDSTLTQLVTQSGAFRYRMGPFTQVTTIAFDPDYSGHILIGTLQAGIMRSVDDGKTWEKIPHTELLPNVSSFFFMGDGGIAVSTYGRGLWKLAYERPRVEIPNILDQPGPPLIYFHGALIPLKDLLDPEKCPVCGFFLARNGRINEVVLDVQSQEVRTVVLSGGRLQGYSFDGKKLEQRFETRLSEKPGDFGGDKQLQEFVITQRGAVKGLYLEGNVLKGYILAKSDIELGQLPRRRELPPRVQLNLVQTGGQPNYQVGDIIEITGVGFDRHLPINVLYDGQPLPVPVEIRFENDNSFRLSIPIFGGLGGHTIVVQQKTPAGMIGDAVTFTFSVSDEENLKKDGVRQNN